MVDTHTNSKNKDGASLNKMAAKISVSVPRPHILEVSASQIPKSLVSEIVIQNLFFLAINYHVLGATDLKSFLFKAGKADTLESEKLSGLRRWIFQKVLAEIVQKGLILSQKALISNRRNFSLFAPNQCAFLQKIANRKISLSYCRNFYERFFPSRKTRLKDCTVA